MKKRESAVVRGRQDHALAFEASDGARLQVGQKWTLLPDQHRRVRIEFPDARHYLSRTHFPGFVPFPQVDREPKQLVGILDYFGREDGTDLYLQFCEVVVCDHMIDV